MFDLTMANLARLEYEERLAWAAMQRRIRKAARYQPNRVDQLLASLGRVLVETGERLQHRVEMRPGLS
jgi:NAD-dependent SIR2 family protein deacetylase